MISVLLCQILFKKVKGQDIEEKKVKQRQVRNKVFHYITYLREKTVRSLVMFVQFIENEKTNFFIYLN